MASKLPRNVKPQKLVKILQSLNFQIIGRRGSHVRLKHPDGRWTQIAVHPKPIPQGTLRQILKQIEMTTQQLTELL